MDRMRHLIVTYRRTLVIATHLFLWTLSVLLAASLRFEFDIPSSFFKILPQLLLLSLVFRTATHWWLGLFHGLWRYSGSRDLRSLVQAATVASLACAAVWGLLGPGFSNRTFPRSIFIMDWAFSILIVGGLRFSIRTLREISIQNTLPTSQGPRRRLLVIGAGDAGEMLMREIVRIYTRRYEPLGFLDDNKTKHGESIHGVPVLGPISRVEELAKSEKIDEIILAIPSLNGREMRKLVLESYPPAERDRALARIPAACEEDLERPRRYFRRLDDGAAILADVKRRLYVGTGQPVGSVRKKEGIAEVWREGGSIFHFFRDPTGRWGYMELRDGWERQKERALHELDVVRENAALYRRRPAAAPDAGQKGSAG